VPQILLPVLLTLLPVPRLLLPVLPLLLPVLRLPPPVLPRLLPQRFNQLLGFLLELLPLTLRQVLQ
jgi:hypothetical protein